MPSIQRTVREFSHDSMPGITLLPLDGTVRRGVPQRVLVQMAPGAVIPLHVHDCDARMIIVAGQAKVISNDNTNDEPVTVGDVVLFEKGAPHGFVAGANGMSFVTENGGIVDDRGGRFWDVGFC